MFSVTKLMQEHVNQIFLNAFHWLETSQLCFDTKTLPRYRKYYQLQNQRNKEN